MSTFVLVHGAWHGGWCYARTARILRKQGHDVYTPTLTGVGERSHLAAKEVNLSLHILDVCNVIKWENLSDIVLCGHSYGGMVITGVADAMPERIRSLVYLDAFVPEDGKGAWDYIADARKPALLEGAAKGGGRMPPAPAAVFNVNAKDAPWVDEKCVPMAFACFLERIRLTGAYARVAKRTNVYAEGWAPSTFTPVYESLKAKPGWKAITSKAGHDVMVDDPGGLAKILLEAR